MSVCVARASTGSTCEARPRYEAVPGIPKASSMLFDLEMEDAAGQHDDSHVAQAQSAITAAVANAQSSIAAQVDAALQLAAGHDCTALAQALVQQGYQVLLRETVGGGVGGQCLRNLHHSFLCCSTGCGLDSNVADSSEGSGPVIIVDPTFRDQFAITRPTPRYTAVLGALPAVFVCQTDRIQPVVELLCAEMSLAFHSTGIVLPPWRYAKSMLSKWLPRRGSLDVNLKLATEGGTGTAAPLIKAAAAQHACVARGAAGAAPAGLSNRPKACSTTLSGCDPASNGSDGSRLFSVTCYTSASGSSGCSTSNDAQQDTAQVIDAVPAQTSLALRPRSGRLPDSCGSGLKQHSFEPMQRVVEALGPLQQPHSINFRCLCWLRVVRMSVWWWCLQRELFDTASAAILLG
eukprot:gene2912-3199_t